MFDWLFNRWPFDQPPRHIRKKLKEGSIPEAGMGYWMITVTLKDGSIYSNVCISDALYGIDFGWPHPITPFRLRDIVDVKEDNGKWDVPKSIPVKIK